MPVTLRGSDIETMPRRWRVSAQSRCQVKNQLKSLGRRDSLGVVLVLHRGGDAVVLHVHEGPLDLLVRRGGLELGHEVAVARGAGLIGFGVDGGLCEINQRRRLEST